VKVPCGNEINIVFAQKTAQGVFVFLEEATELAYLNLLI
jgi:hypothetical protein